MNLIYKKVAHRYLEAQYSNRALEGLRNALAKDPPDYKAIWYILENTDFDPTLLGYVKDHAPYISDDLVKRWLEKWEGLHKEDGETRKFLKVLDMLGVPVTGDPLSAKIWGEVWGDDMYIFQERIFRNFQSHIRLSVFKAFRFGINFGISGRSFVEYPTLGVPSENVPYLGQKNSYVSEMVVSFNPKTLILTLAAGLTNSSGGEWFEVDNKISVKRGSLVETYDKLKGTLVVLWKPFFKHLRNLK